eukprot:EG_transcript_19886
MRQQGAASAFGLAEEPLAGPQQPGHQPAAKVPPAPAALRRPAAQLPVQLRAGALQRGVAGGRAGPQRGRPGRAPLVPAVELDAEHAAHLRLGGRKRCGRGRRTEEHRRRARSGECGTDGQGHGGNFDLRGRGFLTPP